MTRPVNVMAFEWNTPMLVNVLAELSAQHGWQTVYCVSKHTQELVKRHFPEAVYHDSHEARYGRPAEEFADLPWVSLDQSAAEALGYAQVLAFKQMDRLAIMDSFLMHERFLHFHRLVSYWSQVLDRLRPDVLLMPTAPHVIYDYIAYQLARRRGIRTVMFEYVTTEGLLMAIDRFEDGLPPLTAAYRKLLANPSPGPVVLSDRMEDYWHRLQGDYGVAIPQYTRELLERANEVRAAQAEAKKGEVRARAEAEARAKADADAKAEAARRRAELATRRMTDCETRRGAEAASPINRLLRPFGLQRIPRHREPLPFTMPEPFAVPEVPVAAPHSPPPATDGHYQGRFYADAELPDQIARDAAEHRRQHQETISKRYDELAVTPDLTIPFVYVALHLQPERSTNPIGGVFDEQYVLAGMISSVLPRGWTIYVKEHPSQFVPQFVSERGRWTNLYEALVSIPNVSLVTPQIGSFELIDNARAVATVTGTSSWEAIVRRVPTLVFGEAWYKGCPGSYPVRTADDCRLALARIAAGERPNPEATRLFLKAAEDASFVGFLSSDDQPLAGIDEATNIPRLTRAIVECYAASAK